MPRQSPPRHEIHRASLDCLPLPRLFPSGLLTVLLDPMTLIRPLALLLRLETVVHKEQGNRDGPNDPPALPDERWLEYVDPKEVTPALDERTRAETVPPPASTLCPPTLPRPPSYPLLRDTLSSSQGIGTISSSAASDPRPDSGYLSRPSPSSAKTAHGQETSPAHPYGAWKVRQDQRGATGPEGCRWHSDPPEGVIAQARSGATDGRRRANDMDSRNRGVKKKGKKESPVDENDCIVKPPMDAD
ncbi:hypothetical protein C8F01DRAFT_1262862 [Mycena amicta]|nr:hypothetical protein C8F01DRAFT_1262862 [Mycena amicta]